jgi:hypothetical protein
MEYRICINPDCGLEIVSNNPRKKYCSLTCKNKAAYSYKQTVYEWEDRMFKTRRKNIKILEYLFSIKNMRPTGKILEDLGFDLTVAYMPYHDENGHRVYRYGNIGLVVETVNQYQLIKLLHENHSKT